MTNRPTRRYLERKLITGIEVGGGRGKGNGGVEGGGGGAAYSVWTIVLSITPAHPHSSSTQSLKLLKKRSGRTWQSFPQGVMTSCTWPHAVRTKSGGLWKGGTGVLD